MIINTGNRTDIPAFFSKWFYHRLEEGYVDVRSPYDPHKIYRYHLDPKTVDCLCFCTKNPAPMLQNLDKIDHFLSYWMVTITPYGKIVEPNVPYVKEVIPSFKALSKRYGKKRVAWRYDPIFLNKTYTVEKHIELFEKIASELAGYTESCIISFIDLYEKTKRNFPGIEEVNVIDQVKMVKAFVTITKKYGMVLRTCSEGDYLSDYGVDTKGCMTKEVLEEALHIHLDMKETKARTSCHCLLNHDIGVYNTCRHGCLYCYANASKEKVEYNHRLHDEKSSLMIGHIQEDDEIVEVKQESNIEKQLSLF